MATCTKRNDLECSICYEPFKNPKILVCGHSFCLDCIERYIGDRTTFPCPVCGTSVQIPQGGAKKFTTNFALNITPPISLETQITDRPASTSTTTQVTSNTKQPSSTKNHRCPHHSDREVEFYCQTCREGVCARCIHLLHKDHESVDIESDHTKTNAIEEVSNIEQSILQKIKDLKTTSTTLQETSEKLNTLCDEECSKVTQYTEMIIADFREKCEKTRNNIKTHFGESQRKLFEKKAEVDNHVKNLQVDLETKLPSLTEDSCLTILQSTYSKWKEPCDLKQTNIGQLETRPFYLPKLNDFIFSINDIKDDELYFSKNKYTVHGVVWRCFVKRSGEDDLSMGISLHPADNPTIASCDIESKYKLIDHTGKDSQETILNLCFTEKDWCWGRDEVISWKKLTDKQNGFITEDNQLIVQFDITKVINITMKTCK